MKPEEMAIVLEEAKRYTDEQQLGKTITKTISFDGNIEGKYCIPVPGMDFEFNKLVRVSDDPIDLTAETLKSLKTRSITDEVQETKNEVTFQFVPEAGVTMVCTTYSNDCFAWIISQDFEEDGIEFLAGVYFAWLYNGYMYTTSLSYEEIHQIDKKFIPGVVLPAVEIATPPDLESGRTVDLSDGENTALDAAAENGTPCIITSIPIRMSAVYVFAADADGEGNPFFYCNTGSVSMVFQKKPSGGWTLQAIINN